jgi:hypothetical protein
MNAVLLKVQNLCLQLKGQPLSLRLHTLAEFFLGTDYGPWSDGSSIESLDDFNYQLNLLDCVTFVEVALALAKTKPTDSFPEFSKSFEKLLALIHYANGVTNFASRNHFMCMDWIANNKFIVEDITLSLSANTKIASAEIDKAAWTKKHNLYKDINADLPPKIADKFKPYTSRLPYIETTEFLANTSKFKDNFPEYCIVNIVRPNWEMRDKIGTNLNISHLGFAFKDPKTKDLSFYHATSEKKRVVKESLEDYLVRYQDSPTIKGINVLVISPGFYNAW